MEQRSQDINHKTLSCSYLSSMWSLQLLSHLQSHICVQGGPPSSKWFSRCSSSSRICKWTWWWTWSSRFRHDLFLPLLLLDLLPHHHLLQQRKHLLVHQEVLRYTMAVSKGSECAQGAAKWHTCEKVSASTWTVSLGCIKILASSQGGCRYVSLTENPPM